MADQPLDILLLNDSFPPLIDGVANVTLNYARVLTARGDAVSVATPAWPGAVDDYPFAVHRYPSLGLPGDIGYRAGAPFSPEVLHALAAAQPAVIHTHCPVVSTMLARMLRAQVDAPVVFTYHTKFDVDIQKAVKGRLLQQASVRALVNNIAACDEVWVVSEGAGQNLRSLGYQGEYIVMPNGVDMPRGAADEAAVAAACARFGIPRDVPVFLFVGRMMWYKGVETSLRAAAALAGEGQPFCFVLAGDGVDADAIKALSEQLGLAERCIFTGAIQDRDLLRAVFSAADVFLFPSTFDTNGIVVREAAACGCPSVLVAGSCAAEGIDDGRTGFLFDGTVEDMTRVLRHICAEKGLAARVGQAACAGIYLSWEEAVARARARYLQLLDDWHSGRITPAAGVPGDDFYAAAGTVLIGLGQAGAGLEAAGEAAVQHIEAARESVTEHMEDARDTVTQAAQEMRDTVSRRLEDARETVTQTAQEVLDTVTGRIEDARETVSERIEDIRATAARRAETVRELRWQSQLDAAAPREDPDAWLRRYYESYMTFLKDQLTDRLDESREDWEALVQALHDVWEARPGGPRDPD